MSQLPLPLVEPDEISPSRKQWRTKFPADPETDVVAKDRSAGGRRNNVPYVQRMFVAGKCCSTDQDCFPRQRNTSALQHHNNEDCRVAEVCQNVLNPAAIEKVHVACLALSLPAAQPRQSLPRRGNRFSALCYTPALISRASAAHRDRTPACGSGDVRQHRLPCRSGTAA